MNEIQYIEQVEFLYKFVFSTCSKLNVVETLNWFCDFQILLSEASCEVDVPISIHDEQTELLKLIPDFVTNKQNYLYVAFKEHQDEQQCSIFDIAGYHLTQFGNTYQCNGIQLINTTIKNIGDYYYSYIFKSVLLDNKTNNNINEFLKLTISRLENIHVNDLSHVIFFHAIRIINNNYVEFNYSCDNHIDYTVTMNRETQTITLHTDINIKSNEFGFQYSLNNPNINNKINKYFEWQIFINILQNWIHTSIFTINCANFVKQIE